MCTFLSDPILRVSPLTHPQVSVLPAALNAKKVHGMAHDLPEINDLVEIHLFP